MIELLSVKPNPRGANTSAASRGANELLELPLEEANVITLRLFAMRFFIRCVSARCV
jgi:hypothetical protein